MTEPTALDDDLMDAIETASDVIRCPGWEKRATAELAKLRADSAELARMKAGGVWLKRWTEPPTEEGRYLVGRNGHWWTMDRANLGIDHRSGANVYGPLPHEGREDGE